ncbi:MBL fold metallo-hydrolase [Pedobacter sp. KR3-3]|uniref:MBL fold metallo-hydrolase n=1 Tax=Pedobacter albus TaxID=3113905 RepID=A0ABU7IB63_9SPHI|nr:MBL fold metallo-hydrolase [Pedobacter sp. KR3-3]MEE1946697.1 MBL fold metallo-hydrolase [Pedobacter sp. KR3-3]
MISLQKFTFNPYQENTYVLFDESKECVIIDPGMYDGSEQNQLASFIKENGLKPVLLLNTHCHIDHVLGNKFVFDNWGLKPQFHQGELYILQAVPGYAPQMGMRYELSPEPETFLPESGTLSFGNSQLELIFAPGHSPAHLCFYAKEDNFLIGGDVLFYQSIGRTDLPGGNHQQLINSIKQQLFVLPNDCEVFPGHGPSTTIGFEKLNNPFLR